MKNAISNAKVQVSNECQSTHEDEPKMNQCQMNVKVQKLKFLILTYLSLWISF
jgi:hypothetical protein